MIKTQKFTLLLFFIKSMNSGGQSVAFSRKRMCDLLNHDIYGIINTIQVLDPRNAILLVAAGDVVRLPL